MYVVTGGAGFIGSNIVKLLNNEGIDNIIIVDDLKDGSKFENIRTASFFDYMDKDEFIECIEKEKAGNQIKVIFHQGACTDTTEYNGKYMLDNNYNYSKKLLNYAISRGIDFIYASSAAVYGKNRDSRIDRVNEVPVNIYGFSKLLFDNYVRRIIKNVDITLVGLRYFNVYGPGERHKGEMSSMVYQIYNQLKGEGVVRLFEGSDGYDPGEQLRDFVYVEDVAKVNLFFAINSNKKYKGIFNVGTGIARSFNEVFNIWKNILGKGEVEYVPFPPGLKEKYQSFTKADLTNLREAGYQDKFTPLEQGIKKYYEWLQVNEN